MSFTHQETLSNAVSGTNANVYLAGAPSSGELVVMYVHAGGPQTITPDADGGAAWTLGANVENPGSETARHGMWWKIANGSEPSNMSATIGSSDNWHIAVSVYSSASDAEVDAAAASHIQTTNANDMIGGAVRSQVISDDAVSFIGCGKDNRSVSAEVYTTADDSYTNVTGGMNNQRTALASRVFTTGKTYGASDNVTIQTDDGNDGSNDKTYSIHMSFVE